MNDVLEERQCKFITKIPMYAKTVGGIAIPPYQWENENGVHMGDKEIPCKYIADFGEDYCPRHKMEMELGNDESTK